MLPDEDEMKLFDTKHGVILDPDNFKVELHENPSVIEPTGRMRLYVLDLKESMDFYQGLGMKLLRHRSNVWNRPKEASMTAYLVSIILFNTQN